MSLFCGTLRYAILKSLARAFQGQLEICWKEPNPRNIQSRYISSPTLDHKSLHRAAASVLSIAKKLGCGVSILLPEPVPLAAYKRKRSISALSVAFNPANSTIVALGQAHFDKDVQPPTKEPPFPSTPFPEPIL